MCEYVFLNGEKCKEEALKGSKYCILHIPYPEDRNSEEFERIAKLKEEKVKEKINNGDFNFEGVKLFNIDFSNLEIKGDVNFIEAEIIEDISLRDVRIGGDVLFGQDIITVTIGSWGSLRDINAWRKAAKIGGSVWFDGAKIKGDVWFDGVKIGEDVSFEKTTMEKISFSKANIKEEVNFKNCKIGGYMRLVGSRIGGNALFDGAMIEGGVWFAPSYIKGKLSFKNTTFKNLRAQEETCQAAVRALEKLGDREGADYHFYREMVAKRKQKNFITRIFEWLLADFTCSYGTNFFKPLWIWLISVLVVFPVIYYFGHGIASPNTFFPFFKGAAGSVKSFLSAEYFSIITATTLGYGDLQPAQTTIWHIPIFRVLAGLEAIFGTFMWVIFLTVFARKYMR